MAERGKIGEVFISSYALIDGINMRWREWLSQETAKLGKSAG